MKTYWKVVWSLYISIVVGVAWHLACTPTTPDGGTDSSVGQVDNKRQTSQPMTESWDKNEFPMASDTNTRVQPAVRIDWQNTFLIHEGKKWVWAQSSDNTLRKAVPFRGMFLTAYWRLTDELAPAVVGGFYHYDDNRVLKYGPKIIVNPPPSDEPRKTATKPRK